MGIQRHLLVTGVKGQLVEPTVELHRVLRPRHDITNQMASAGRLAGDLTGCQDSGPELEIRQLSHEGLSDVKATAHGVLWRVTKSLCEDLKHVGWTES